MKYVSFPTAKTQGKLSPNTTAYCKNIKPLMEMYFQTNQATYA